MPQLSPHSLLLLMVFFTLSLVSLFVLKHYTTKAILTKSSGLKAKKAMLFL
uniref:ATP synthase F0 subunit 8 n=1 Tax=Monacha cartusiana TaxID=225461 RepID=UPI0023D8C682|nr:ATP synthase F0 subunit 8 [Monacha cartusiana]URP31101.1 ATP synthase F0 subunit 8 [Monacha cartusiana]